MPSSNQEIAMETGKQIGKDRTALVLGATGGIGGAVARRLRDAGWRVRGLKRGLAQDREWRGGIEWRRGDALNAADVSAAAQGCGVIVHAVNPPGYKRWAELVLPMLDSTLRAAREQGATVLLPGTVYNFGPDALPAPHEDAPQRPLTRKGAIRVEMERRLQALAESGEGRVVILRAGDYFGPGAVNSWFSQAMVNAGRPVTRVNRLATPGVGHQWAYLPDVAQAMVALLERRERLPAFARYHFAGHWDADGLELPRAVQRVVEAHGGARPRVGAFPWWLMTLASPFVTFCREAQEMRYLWREPLRMPGERLAAELGAEPHTPLDLAVENALRAAGCLPLTPAPAAATAARS
jgi:nucleoside-diphosphate-sugar epimerase